MAQFYSESTSLISAPEDHGIDYYSDPCHNKSDGQINRKAFHRSLSTTPLKEAKILARTAAPVMLTSLLQYSFNGVTVVAAGYIGTAELGAISLATMTANLTGIAVYEGLATSLDTLCSQAYGSGNKEMVGLHLQRMVYFLWLVTVPIGVLWAFSPHILGMIVPEKDLADLAGSYLRIYLIGAPGYATFEAGKRFVQAQGRFEAPLFVLLVGAPLNVLLNWMFVWKLQFGLRGAAMAIAITNLFQPALLLFYVRYITPSTLACWPGFTRSAFHNWGPMFRLAVPGILMIEAEWFAFEILTISSAFLGRPYLAAQSVLVNTTLLMCHLPFSASVAVSTRVGNLIGCGAIPAAKVAVKTFYMFFIIVGLIDMGVMIGLKGAIPRVFSRDDVVMALVETVMPPCALFQLVYCMSTLCNGLLRGLGRQKIGGLANLVSYYGLYIPTSLFLTFGPPQLGLTGLWVGLPAGPGLVTLIDSIFIKYISWGKCFEDAKIRSSLGPALMAAAGTGA